MIPLSEQELLEHLQVLRNDSTAPRSSKLVSSNLRRAIATMAGIFSDARLANKDEKILLHPSLQEISRNPDTLAITPPQGTVQAAWYERTYKQTNFQQIYDRQVDTSLHMGDKALSSNGLKRMLDFCDYCFSYCREDCIIAGGHSIWFRSFFRTFLPYSVTHPGKDKKMVNGGIVTFELLRIQDPNKNESHYMIDPKTLRVVYGGFK